MKTKKMTKAFVDKRTTNPAMRIVRAHYPGIGAAYSDKRAYGRRYKFIWYKSNQSNVNALNTLFRLNGINATAELHKGTHNWGPSWKNHLIIKSYDRKHQGRKNTTPERRVVEQKIDEWLIDELNKLQSAVDWADQFAAKPVNKIKTFTFTEEQLILFTNSVIQEFVENHATDNILRTLQKNTTNELCPNLIDINASIDSDGIMKMRPAINEWTLMEEIETNLNELVKQGLSGGAIERLAQFTTQLPI